MRIQVVSSPHSHSTRDVFLRVVKGLRQNGVDVRPYDLLPRWQGFEVLIGLARARRMPLPGGFSARTLAYEPVLGAALYHEVDWSIIVSPQYVPPELPRLLRRAGVRVAAYWTECPYEDFLFVPECAELFDLCFVSDRYSVGHYRSFNERVVYLPHCYDPDVHYPGGDERDLGVVFVGTVYRDRWELLRRVRWDGLDVRIHGLVWGRRSRRWRERISADLVDNEQAAALYRRARASFNVHRTLRWIGFPWPIDEGEAYSLNPRAYELAACETFQVSDWRPELRDVFGDAVPVYRTPGELGRLLRRAMDDPVWRQERARAQREAVQGHDCRARMRTALEALAA